ncbi:MAG: pantetheine-phosphate adenylyltransferase [Clostridia bacterium]|nr:pantetheine-phosphate adenylyltransferase [Clostridia bacterium]
MKTCVFAGTFDPPTKGHIEVINKALEIFDQVIVGILINPTKTPLFTETERKKLLVKALEDKERVEVVTHGGMLVDLLKAYDTKFYIRGIRDEVDYKYERDMCYYNQELFEDMITVFVQAPKDLAFVSSSNLRELIKNNQDFSEFVPENIYEDIKKLIAKG